MFRKKLSKMLHANEFYIALVIIVIFALVCIINPVFFSSYSIVSVLKTCIEPLIFAIGEFIIIVSGGIDISVAGIGAFSMFTTTKILYAASYQGNAVLAYAMAILFGAALGCINGLLVSRVKVAPMIATLGMNSVINGAMLFFIGSREISNVPKGILEAGRSYLFTTYNAKGIAAPMYMTVFIAIGLLIVMYFVLHRTILGRNIYSIGGDSISAERSGINVPNTQLVAYTMAGAIYGLGGMVHTVTYVNSNPMDLLGQEMLTIAAVIIGGARITGGHGSLTGCVIGVILVQLINNCLNTVGIPSYWQRFVVGMVLVIGTSLTAYQALREKRKLHVEISEPDAVNE